MSVRELSYREICQIMGHNLRVIRHDEDPCNELQQLPEQVRLELFAAEEGKAEK